MERIEKNMTCIICPRGCLMKVVKDGEEVLVEGNGCPKGKDYAFSELTNPTRTVTSSVFVSNREGKSVSVKTDRPVSKQHIFDVMNVIRSTLATAPVTIGDVIKADVYGCNIVATSEIE